MTYEITTIEDVTWKHGFATLRTTKQNVYLLAAETISEAREQAVANKQDNQEIVAIIGKNTPEYWMR